MFLGSNSINYLILSALVIITVGCREIKKSENLSISDLEFVNNMISEVIGEISSNYVEPIEREKLEEGAINGIMSSLDEYSVYINKDDLEAFNSITRGNFLGIGIELKQTKNGIEVISVIEGSPAFKSGIKQGDFITYIDGKPVSEMNLKEIFRKLGSELSSKTKLKIIRSGAEEDIEVTLKKSLIKLKSVKLEVLGDIANIKITHFNENTSIELSDIAKQITRNEDLKGIVLDLRGNPGGMLDQAISSANMFLSSGKIVEFKSRLQEESKIIFADSKEFFNSLPMAILIDKNTASGAELMAAALGDNKRAILIGEKTYGKGSIQSIITIPGKGAIKLTTGYMFTPNGQALNKLGVTPNIQDKQQASDQTASTEDALLQKAIDILHGISVLGAQ